MLAIIDEGDLQRKTVELREHHGLNTTGSLPLEYHTKRKAYIYAFVRLFIKAQCNCSRMLNATTIRRGIWFQFTSPALDIYARTFILWQPYLCLILGVKVLQSQYFCLATIGEGSIIEDRSLA